jgi:hypothetical protein
VGSISTLDFKVQNWSTIFHAFIRALYIYFYLCLSFIWNKGERLVIKIRCNNKVCESRFKVIECHN